MELNPILSRVQAFTTPDKQVSKILIVAGLILFSGIAAAAIGCIVWRWSASSGNQSTEDVPPGEDLPENQSTEDVPPGEDLPENQSTEDVLPREPETTERSGFKEIPQPEYTNDVIDSEYLQRVEENCETRKQAFLDNASTNPSASYWVQCLPTLKFQEYGESDILGVMLQPRHQGDCSIENLLLYMLLSSKSPDDTLFNELPILTSSDYQKAIESFRDKAGNEVRNLQRNEEFQTYSLVQGVDFTIPSPVEIQNIDEKVKNVKTYKHPIATDELYAIAKWLDIEVYLVNRSNDQLDVLNKEPNRLRNRVYIAQDGGGFEYLIPSESTIDYLNNKVSI